MLKARLYSGTVLVLGAVQLIESIATALPLSYFPNYVTELGATVASVGLFTSSFMLASAVMSPRFGSFSGDCDVIGHGEGAAQALFGR